MKALLQRVSEASVKVDDRVVGQIGKGLLVLLGIDKNDTEASADHLLNKLLDFRLFPDAEGKMNLSISQVAGGILLVSQFTLSADTCKGLRPSFSSAAPPAQAEKLYNYVLGRLSQRHAPTASGIFGADMQVALVNDGPVTFLLEG